jgi:hypothetical protein
MATATAIQPVTSTDSRVVNALENPKYVWRTVAGLSRDTGLSKDEVTSVLHNLPSDTLIATDSRKGRLYSTRSHYAQHRSTLSRILTALSDTPK